MSLISVVQADRHIYDEILTGLESSPLINQYQAVKIQRFINLAIQHIQEACPSVEKQEESGLSAEEVVILHFRESLTHFSTHFKKAINPNFEAHKKNPFYAQAIGEETIKILRQIEETGSIMREEAPLGRGGIGVVSVGKCGDEEVVEKKILNLGRDHINILRLQRGSSAVVDLAHPAFGDVFLVKGTSVVLEKGITNMAEAIDPESEYADLIHTNIVQIMETLLQGGSVLIDPSRSDVAFHSKVSKEEETETLFASDVPMLTHGDIKLENIMIFQKLEDGRLIVKFVDHDTIGTADCKMSSSFTITYLSPEAARERAGPLTDKFEFDLSGVTITPKYDSWSLGVVFYGMLFGRRLIDDLADITGHETKSEPGILSALKALTQNDLDKLIAKRVIQMKKIKSFGFGESRYEAQMIALGKQKLQHYLIASGKLLVTSDEATDASDEELIKLGREDYIRVYKESGLKELEEKVGTKRALAFLMERGKYLFESKKLSKYYQLGLDEFIKKNGKECLINIAVLMGKSSESITPEEREAHIEEMENEQVNKLIFAMKDLLKIDPKQRKTAIEVLYKYFSPDPLELDNAYTFDDVFEFDPKLMFSDISALKPFPATEVKTA